MYINVHIIGIITCATPLFPEWDGRKQASMGVWLLHATSTRFEAERTRDLGILCIYGTHQTQRLLAY